MEIIGKISKGSKMDQVYIPKNRDGLDVGSYVVLRTLEIKKPVERPYFYNIKFIEPIKLRIIGDIIDLIGRMVNYKNIIITGSFLEKGFNFNDVDVLIISEKKIDKKNIVKKVENKIKIKIHLIVLNNETLMKGLSTDPLYQMMLSKCIAKKRFVYRIKPRINYKILDLHLLRSELLINNFDNLNGNEKYYFIRNMIAISLYLKYRKVNKEGVDAEIKRIFNLKNINEIKQNMLDKKVFLKKYKMEYKKIFNKIMEGIKSGSK